MPNLKREHLGDALLAPLSSRIRRGHVPVAQLVELARWLDGNPIVPNGKWFKRFVGFTVSGEGELVKTFLVEGELPEGTEVR